MSAANSWIHVDWAINLQFAICRLQFALCSFRFAARSARLPIADGLVCNFNVLVIALLMCINCHLISRPVCVVSSCLTLFICFPFSLQYFQFYFHVWCSHTHTHTDRYIHTQHRWRFANSCQVPNSKERFNYLSNYGNLRSRHQKPKLICRRRRRRRFIILMTGINYLRYIMSNLFNLLPPATAAAATTKRPQHHWQSAIGNGNRHRILWKQLDILCFLRFACFAFAWQIV